MKNTEERQDYNQVKSFKGTIDVQIAIPNVTVTMHSEPVSCVTNESGKCVLEGIIYGTHRLKVVDNENKTIANNILKTN